MRIVPIAFALVICSPAFAQPAAPATRPAKDPQVDAIVQRASKTLASRKQFAFEAHSTTEHVLPSGEKIQLSQNQKITVRRPDALAAIVQGDRDDLRFWYDGKHVGLYNARGNVYSVTDAPPSIDATLDLLATKYGMALPLADLVMSDPNQAMCEHVTSSTYLGTGYVFDAICHHLAFRQDGIDWELWVDSGEQAVPRKLVIHYRDAPQSPEYTAFLTQWDLDPKLSDAAFASPAPKEAKQLPFSAGPVPAPGTVAK